MSDEQIVIMWMERHKDELSTLAYNGGQGPIRVYRENAYDPRCDLGRAESEGPLPVLRSAPEALVTMRNTRGALYQVPVPVARQLGLQIGD